MKHHEVLYTQYHPVHQTVHQCALCLNSPNLFSKYTVYTVFSYCMDVVAYRISMCMHAGRAWWMENSGNTNHVIKCISCQSITQLVIQSVSCTLYSVQVRYDNINFV